MESRYDRTFQIQLIRKLNTFSQTNNLKITLNPTGVCHALSIIWSEHANSKNLPEFERILTVLEEGEPKEEVTKWIKRIDKIQEPLKYDANRPHWKTEELTKDNVLYKEANFFTLEEFLNTIEKFDLKKSSIIWGYNERSEDFHFGHAVSLSQNEQGQYLFFDPNIGKTITCDSREELEKELLDLLQKINSSTEIFPASITYTSKTDIFLDTSLRDELTKDKIERLDKYYNYNFGGNSLLSWIIFHGDINTAEELISRNELSLDMPTLINAVESQVPQFLASHKEELYGLITTFYEFQAKEYGLYESPGYVAQMKFMENFGKKFDPLQLKKIKDRFITVLEKTADCMDKKDRENLKQFIISQEEDKPFLSHPRKREWLNKIFDTESISTMKKLTK